MKDSQIELEDLDVRIRDLVRMCTFGKFSTTDALKYINSGILGKRTNTRTKQEEVITISRTTYFKYKRIANDINEATKEFWEFTRQKYVIEIKNILSLLSELQSRSLYNLARETDPLKNQRIIDSIVRNLPPYTQYMEALKVMLEKGKLPVGVDLGQMEKTE